MVAADADGVGGGIDRDAVIGGPDHGLDSLAVARLADDHRGGTAAQRRTQAVGKTLEMAGDLRGRHQRAVPFDMIEHELDGRLIGLDAPGAALQQPPRAGGEQGRLARARHAGHQGQAAPQIPGLDDLVLDAEFLEARRRAGQNPERDVHGKTARGLHRGEVATEAPEDAARLGHGMGTVDGPPAAQDAFAGGIENARAQAAERDAVENRAGRPRQPAVNLDEGGRAGLEGDVGSAALRGPQQKGVEPFNRKHMRRLGPICVWREDGPIGNVSASGHCRSPPPVTRHALVSRLKAARLSSRTLVSPIRSRRSWPVAAV